MADFLCSAIKESSQKKGTAVVLLIKAVCICTSAHINTRADVHGKEI
jgi:hypothetical protein